MTLPTLTPWPVFFLKDESLTPPSRFNSHYVASLISSSECYNTSLILNAVFSNNYLLVLFSSIEIPKC